MATASPLLGPLSDLVARCVLAFERDGEAAVDKELATRPELAAEARTQLEALKRVGLLSAPTTPESFGPYRVLRRLGIGGMGTVWLCEQHRPIHRKVAVKVMRTGFDHDELLARFQVERHALGLLNDPCIARVLDSGITADRRPYLVMDYVPGQTITQFCDARGLSLAQRLQLFARVCDGVQHAHHKGIVHRDLKPSNVLVVEHGGEPLPIVIDFGVAKFVSNAMLEGSLLTLPGRLIGTPEYMSPEQARGDVDIDTRTDIYSLGVLLYELLTGCLPIASTRLRNLAELGRVLDEVDPPRASVCVAGLSAEDLRLRAEQRGMAGIALVRALRGELDWITRRAMEKERDRRYVTAADLAQDVRRHLQQEPITAGPPSRWYALRKFCLRHRLPVAGLLLFTLALAAMTTVSLLFWREAAAAERSASASNARLEQNLNGAILALDRMVALGADGLRTPASEPMRRALLRTALDLHEQLSAGGGTPEPRLTASLAAALGRSAQLHQMLGESQESDLQLARAEQALAGLGNNTGPGSIASMQTGHAHLVCGTLRERRSEVEFARAHYEAARSAFARAAAAGGDARAVRTGQIMSLRKLADLQTSTDVGAARSLLAAARPLAEAQLADAEAIPSQRVEGQMALVSLAWLDGETDQGSEAVELLTRMLEQVESRYATDLELSEQLRFAPVLQQLANTAVRLREGELARRALGRLLGTLHAAIEAEPAVAMHRVDLAQAMLLQALFDSDTVEVEAVHTMELEALRMEEEGVAQQGHVPELNSRLLGHLLDFAWRRLDWLELDDAHRACVDLDQLAGFVDKAMGLWNGLPPTLQRDRHAREAWLQSYSVRAGLAKQRHDLEARRHWLSEGLVFADRLAADHPGIVQVRMMRAEINLELARVATEQHALDTAWKSARRALDDLVAASPLFARPTRWQRLGYQILPTAKLLGQLASTRSPAGELGIVATSIAGIAALAQHADAAAAEALRDDANGVLRVAVQAGLTRTSLSTHDCELLRSLPAFDALPR